MSGIQPTVFALGAALVSILLTSCGNPVQTNTGPGTETIGLVMHVTYPSGRPARGARAYVRTARYLADTAAATPPSPDAVVDSLGYVRFDGLPVDEYRIEVRDTSSFTALIDCDARGHDDSLIDLGVRTLTLAARVHGTIRAAGATTYLRIRGLERVLRVSDSMVYNMHQLPAAALSLHCLAQWPDTALEHESALEIEPGAQHSIVHVLLPGGSSPFDGDTLRATTVHIQSLPTWTGSIVVGSIEARRLTCRILGSGITTIRTATWDSIDVQDTCSGIVDIGPLTAETVRYKSCVSSIAGLSSVRAQRSWLSFLGSSTFNLGRLEGDSVRVDDDGSGVVRIDSCAVRTAHIRQGGSGECTINGQARSMRLSVEANGVCDGFGLLCDSVWVSLLDHGEARVYAGTYLETNNTGSGAIYYRGTPFVAHNGTGTVEPALAASVSFTGDPAEWRK